MPEQHYNSLAVPTTTLASGVDASATSLTLATGGGAALPPAGTFSLLLCNPDGSGGEIVSVGGRTGDVVSGVVRGAESDRGGGTPVAHGAGSWVVLSQTARSLEAAFAPIGRADPAVVAVAAPGGLDDTAAIQAALDAANAAGGGRVLLGPGVYLCGALVPRADVELAGAGMLATTIKLKDGANADLLVATGAHRFGLRDLTLDGNKANNTAAGNWNGLFLTTSDDVRVHRVRTLNVDWIGLAFAGCPRADVSECLIDSPDYVGVWFGTSGAVHCTGARLSRSAMLACGLDGCIADSDDVLILGNWVDGTGRITHASGLYVAPGRRRVRVEGNQCQNTSGHGIDFDTSSTDDSYGCVCVGNVCQFNRDSGIGCDSNGAVIQGNQCLNNGFAQGAAGAYPYGIIADGKDIVVSGNRCTDTRAGGSKTQTYGISLRNVSTVTAQCVFVGNDVRGNVNAGINGITTIGTGHVSVANPGAPDYLAGNVSINSLITDHKLVIESNANDHLRFARVGNTYVYDVYVASDRSLVIAKPTGDAGASANAPLKLTILGGADAINPYWSGLHLVGHTVTEGGANVFPVLVVYSRSAILADPTDYEYVMEVGSNASRPVGLVFKAPSTAGSYWRVLFGATEQLRLAQNGTLTIKGPIDHDGSTVGFFGTAPVAKPTVTGSRGGNAALASLLTALAGLGLLTDSSTA